MSSRIADDNISPIPTSPTRTLLLVEDEAIISLAQKKTLEQSGYRVVTAFSGEDARALFSNPDGGGSAIDLVLMDIDLGDGIDGTEAAQEILRIKEVPIVFLTSHAEQEIVDKVKGITRYGYVLKNSGTFVLREAITTAFELFAKHRALVRENHEKSRIMRRYEEAQRIGLVGNWEYDIAAERFWGSRGTLRIFGFDPELVDLTVEQVEARIPDRTRVHQALLDLICDGTPYDLTYTILPADGGPARSIRSVAEVESDGAGHPVRVIGSLRDITGTDPDSTDPVGVDVRYETLVANICDVITVIDRNGINRYKSPNVYQEFGWHPHELVGQSTFDQVHPDDRAAVTGVFSDLLQEPGSRHSGKCRYRLRDGTYRWIRYTAVNRLDNPAINGILLNFRDVTERHETQEQLQQSEERFRALFEQSVVGIILADATNTVVDINPRGAELLGYSREKFIGLNGRDIIHPDDLEQRPIQSITSEILDDGRVLEIENRFRRRDGSYIEVLVQAGRIQIGDEPGLHLVVFRDVTLRKAAERRVEQLLDEKQLLLREVHHRIKNNMSLLSSLLSLHADTLHDPAAQAALLDARHRLGSMQKLYDRLYRSENVREMSVRAYLPFLAEDILASFNGTRNVALEAEVADIVLDVRTLSYLGIIVNELVTNAMKHAFGDNRNDGRILLRLETRDGATGTGNDLEISLTDNGVGFGPGFDLQAHAGFGLQMIRTLADQLDGTLTARAETPGTTFRITIPRPTTTARISVGP